MELSFFDVLITVATLLLMIIPGFVLAKTKIFKEGATDVLSKMVLYGCQPALMVMMFQKSVFRTELLLNMLIAMGLSALMHLLMVAFVLFAFRNKKGEDAEVENAKMRCMRAGSVFGNIGYMGIPFIQMLFANSDMLGEILIYVAVGITVFNILNWSFGIYLVTGERKYISFKKAFLNPTGISIIIGLIIFLIARVPIVDLASQGSVLDEILTAIMGASGVVADMITPLAMSVIGIRLANMKLKDLFTEKWVYVTSLNKLVIMSILTMFIIWIIPVNSAIKASLFFAASMPAATSTVLFAVNFGGDSKIASSIVVQTVLFSIITIPLMFLLLTRVFGITF